VAFKVEGRKHRALSEDCKAVSEVVGQALMIAVVVLAFSSISVVIFSDVVVNHPHTPQVNMQENIDSTKNKLYILHVGGEAIDLKDVNIVLSTTDMYRQEEFNLSSNGSEFDFKAPNNIFTLGDSITISPINISLGTNETIMFFVYTPSQQVIQKATLYTGK
jgi:archaeal type IV pilus assembly protein PilA